MIERAAACASAARADGRAIMRNKTYRTDHVQNESSSIELTLLSARVHGLARFVIRKPNLFLKCENETCTSFLVTEQEQQPSAPPDDEEAVLLVKFFSAGVRWLDTVYAWKAPIDWRHYSVQLAVCNVRVEKRVRIGRENDAPN